MIAHTCGQSRSSISRMRISRMVAVLAGAARYLTVAGILIAVDAEWHLEEIPDASFTHELSFVEEVTSEREDLVAGLIEFVATVPGVDRVDRVDREAALITAPGLPAPRLAAAMRRWWARARRQRPAWKGAFDRAVRTIEDL